MTANLIVHTPEGFLFAADSRLLSGSYVLTDHAQKLFRLSDFSACVCSGYFGDGGELHNFFQTYADTLQTFSVRQAAVFVWEHAAEIFARLPPDALTSITIAGYSAQIPQLFRILLHSDSITLEVRRHPQLQWIATGDETFTGVARESRLLDGVPALDIALEHARHLILLSQELLARRLPVSPIGGTLQFATITPTQPFRTIS